MTKEKHFPKNISQWEFDYGLFTNLPIIIVARNFSLSSFKNIRELNILGSFKFKRGILPVMTKYVSQLENYKSYQGKMFLVNYTPRELTPCKMFHICRCAFQYSLKVSNDLWFSVVFRRHSQRAMTQNGWKEFICNTEIQEMFSQKNSS